VARVWLRRRVSPGRPALGAACRPRRATRQGRSESAGIVGRAWRWWFLAVAVWSGRGERRRTRSGWGASRILTREARDRPDSSRFASRLQAPAWRSRENRSLWALRKRTPWQETDAARGARRRRANSPGLCEKNAHAPNAHLRAWSRRRRLPRWTRTLIDPLLRGRPVCLRCGRAARTSGLGSAAALATKQVRRRRLG
jgi:hypothetical protein